MLWKLLKFDHIHFTTFIQSTENVDSIFVKKGQREIDRSSSFSVNLFKQTVTIACNV